MKSLLESLMQGELTVIIAAHQPKICRGHDARVAFT